MPELENNPAISPTPKIDFDEWASLAKADPEKFEARRRDIIEAAIARSCPNQQQRLRSLQWKIDQVRKLSPTPIAACVKISNLMWDSLAGPGGLQEKLEQLQHPSCKLRSAKVLSISPEKKK